MATPAVGYEPQPGQPSRGRSCEVYPPVFAIHKLLEGFFSEPLSIFRAGFSARGLPQMAEVEVLPLAPGRLRSASIPPRGLCSTWDAFSQVESRSTFARVMLLADLRLPLHSLDPLA